MTANPSQLQAKSRRILISGGLAVGGTQTHVTLLCRVLLQAGAEVTVAAASADWPDEAIGEIKALGVRFVFSPFGFGPLKILGKAWALVLWYFLLRRDYDVLYCIGVGKIHLWASRFLRKTGWKIYHEIADFPFRDSVVAQVVARMDAVVANSRSIGRQIAGLLKDIPVRTIPFLTSSAPMNPPAKRARVAERTLRIAFLGRMVSHKRPDRLIEAWPAWRARAPIGPARLDLYGGDYDNERTRLQSRITALGLEDSIRLHGVYMTSDLPKIFDATDIVVLPSVYEGLPLVLVEAMQRGIPVVATAAGGTAELGENNPDVIITEGVDWQKFAEGLALMAERVRAGQIDSARLHDWT